MTKGEEIGRWRRRRICWSGRDELRGMAKSRIGESFVRAVKCRIISSLPRSCYSPLTTSSNLPAFSLLRHRHRVSLCSPIHRQQIIERLVAPSFLPLPLPIYPSLIAILLTIVSRAVRGVASSSRGDSEKNGRRGNSLLTGLEPARAGVSTRKGKAWGITYKSRWTSRIASARRFEGRISSPC